MKASSVYIIEHEPCKSSRLSHVIRMCGYVDVCVQWHNAIITALKT